MIRVAIIGAGTLGQHIAHFLNQSDKFQVSGFYDDTQEKNTNTVNGRILGNISNVSKGFTDQDYDQLLIGIGYNHMPFRQQLFDTYIGTIPFATFIHPSCYLDPSVVLGAGVVALPGCIFDMNVQIGNNVFFNSGCLIAHDTTIGDNCFFGPSVNIAGFVRVENHCFLGVGTTIIDNINVCSHTNTGGNCTVIKDITIPGNYVGIPARIINKF